ncbi:MAG: hypothetical protein A4E19_09515 [Nitrospira sp. SG-bin1]|nr:MAG: hypothetical protein A4E19_09515 [Nitrospira sp. SG-bin1]
MTVQGIVQGVGFRPYVYGLASRLGLKGIVRNDSKGAVIDVEGDPLILDQFVNQLVKEAPPLSSIEQIEVGSAPIAGYRGFSIERSVVHEEAAVFIAPDTAMCQDCLSELTNPRDRRYGYPFLNCTNCGPRFTIVTDVPYDRERITMAGFTMCPACKSEYDNPLDRRFHAQPTACPVCGPQLQVTDSSGTVVPINDPVAFTAICLKAGLIFAIKGLGGYHLACDAQRNDIVMELRKRKHREAKPLAVMVPSLEAANRLCWISAHEAQVLTSTARPIVLLQKRDDCYGTEAVAPGHRYLGVMLPYTPLHHLLMQALRSPLVMTSGNLTDEPIAYKDQEAIEHLSSIADYFLVHNRPIHMRCDDSVIRVVKGTEQFVRRSRGYAPLPISLKQPVPVPLLACGGQMKNAFSLARGRYAFLSHHIGDLDDYRTYKSFQAGVEHLKNLFSVDPEAVAHDLHPGYLSTQYARSLRGLPQIPVQHHHAHIAACMAENSHDGPVIGVAFDGTGYGTDGHIWGGEFLLTEYHRFDRLAYLGELPLPGGEQAIHQPWRMAAACLYHAYGDAMARLDLPFLHRMKDRVSPVVKWMIAKQINTPLTSSAGRLFDGIASLVGVRDEVQYDAQAAIELELLAEERTEKDLYPICFHDQGNGFIAGTRGIIRGVVDDLVIHTPAPVIASRFHSTMAALIHQTCRRIRRTTGLRDVALSGGCFQNVRLLTETVERLSADGFKVLTHHKVPPNDGGLALGQVAVAAAVLEKGRRKEWLPCA